MRGKAGALLPWFVNPAVSAGKWLGEKSRAGIDWALKAADSTGKWASDKVHAGMDWMKGKAGALLPGMVNPVGQAGKWAGEKSRSAMDWAITKAAATQNWVKGKAGSAAGWAQGKAGAAANWAKKKVASVSKPVSAAAQWAGNKVHSAGEWAGKKAASAWQWVTGGAGAFGRGLPWSMGFLSVLPGTAGGAATLRMASYGPPARQSRDGNGEEVEPTLLRDRVLAAEGTGFAPSSSVMQPMERMLRSDFGDVRFHAGPAAAETARDLNAEAFTIGQDVFFGKEQYDPTTPQGQGLIAHELTHVVQQTGTDNGALRFATREGGDAMEGEAQQARRMVLAKAAGNRHGLFVDDYQRNYEVEEGGLAESDIERLNSISLKALELAEQTAQREGIDLLDSINILEVEISLDLVNMTDQEAAMLWAEAICIRLRSDARMQVMAHSGSRRRITRSGSRTLSPSPILAKSPIQLQRAPATKDTDESTNETLKQIAEYTNRWAVTSFTEWKIERLWNSIPDLPGLIKRNPKARELFRKGAEKGMEVDNLKQARHLVPQFEKVVKQVAYYYLFKNITSVAQEMKRLGLGGVPKGDKNAEKRANMHIKQVQDLAGQVMRLQEQQKELKKMIVGSEMRRTGRIADEIQEREFPVKFDPDHKPAIPAKVDQGMIPYEKVKKNWNDLLKGIGDVAHRNPGIYAMLRDGKISKVAVEKGATEAWSLYRSREALRECYTDLKDQMAKALGKIAYNQLDHRQLLPIHEQLFRNKAGGSDAIDKNWSDPFRQTVGRAIVEDYQNSQFWKSLGLGAAAAALFVVAEIASAGTATALLVGTSMTALQAASSLDEYLTLSGASKAAVSDDTALVEQRQVDSAKLETILSMVGLFIEGYQLASKLMKVGFKAAAARPKLIRGPVEQPYTMLPPEPLRQDLNKLLAIMRLTHDDQVASGLLLARLGEKGCKDVARMIETNPEAMSFVAKHGLRGLEVLKEAKGNLINAGKLLKLGDDLSLTQTKFLQLTPDEFASDPALQRALFENAKQAQASQQALADRILAENGINIQVKSILKRPDLNGFVEKVLDKCKRKKYNLLAKMDDIVRGRFNLPDEESVRKVVKAFTDLPNARVQAPPRPGYPRYHAIVRDQTTGIMHEWQIGTTAVSRVFEDQLITIPDKMKRAAASIGKRLGKEYKNDFHDIEYDIIQQVAKKRPDLDLKYGLKAFSKKLDKLAIKAGKKGDSFKRLDKEIKKLSEEVSDILKKMFDNEDPMYLVSFLH